MDQRVLHKLDWSLTSRAINRSHYSGMRYVALSPLFYSLPRKYKLYTGGRVLASRQIRFSSCKGEVENVLDNQSLEARTATFVNLEA